MVGQGCPPQRVGAPKSPPIGRRRNGARRLLARATPCPRLLPLTPLRAIAVALLVAWQVTAGSAWAADELLDLRLQLAWGGGAVARPWTGSISLAEGTISEVVSLGFDADQTRSLLPTDHEVLIRQSRPRQYDGAVMRVRAPRSGSLRVQIASVDGAAAARTFEIPLIDFLERDFLTQLDDQRNSLMIHRRGGDSLRVEFHRDSLVFSPGERWTFDVVPHELRVPSGSIKATLRLTAQATGKVVWSQEHPLRADEAGQLPPLVGQGITIPSDEGVYLLEVSLHRSWTKAPFSSSRPIAERAIQLVVVRSAPDPTAGNPASESEIVAEFDPAHPSWWERLPKFPASVAMRRWWPGNRETRLASDGVTNRDWNGRRWVELPPGGWQAFPLPLEHAGEPHEVLVEYPATAPQTLAISWLDPNAAGELAPGNVDTGVVVQQSVGVGLGAIDRPELGTQRMLVWPRAEGSILLVVNRSSDRPAHFGTIRVRRLAQPLQSAAQAAPSRQVLAYLDGPTLTTTFSGAEQIDRANSRTFEDWGTFHQATEHLLEYLGYIGYQGAAILVAGEGSTLYPSDVWRPTPRMDRGMFFSTGQDPVRKDVVEMMLRAADRDGMTIVPLIRFNSTLHWLELALQDPDTSVGIQLVDLTGKPAAPGGQPIAGVGPHYNPLDPRVQRAMVAAIDELVGRYAHHRSFGGVVIDLADNTYTHLPNWNWGADRATWARFAIAQPAGSVPLDLEPAQALRDPNVRALWVGWRVAELTQLYTAMHESLRARRPDIRLYLAPNGVMATSPLRQALWPVLDQQRRVGIDSALATIGLDLVELARLPQLVVLRPRRYAPSQGVAQNVINLQLNGTSQLDSQLDRAASVGPRADLIVHEMDRATVESFDRVSPYGEAKTYTVLETVFSESGAEYRRPFTAALQRRDANLIFDGGWSLPLGQQDHLRDLLAAYQQLPAGRFEPVVGEGIQLDPVQIRKLTDHQRTYFYVLNPSPWRVRVETQWSLPFGTGLHGLGARQLPRMEFSQGRAAWVIELEPFELVAGVMESADVELAQAQSTVRPEVVQRLRELIARVKSQIDRLQQPVPLAMLANPGFELGVVDQRPQSWVASEEAGGRVAVTRDRPAEGQQACVLESQGGRAWLVSEPIAPPQSGRMYVSVRLRSQDPTRQPRLQFGIEGRHDGRPFNRADQLGGAPNKILGEEWREFVFPVEDLPTQGLSQLRVTFDLLDPGAVAIDDVRVYDLYLTEAERKFVQLSIVAVANQWISEGKLDQCAALLESFWPRMLIEYDGPDQSALAEQSPATADRPNRLRNGTKDGSSISETLRKVVPRLRR